jgi:methionyl-tRNA formyltransferase
VRALFLGTPEFAVPSLDALQSMSDIVGVVCQPDRPAGRGLAPQVPAVKARALELGLPVVQPTKLRTGEFEAWVKEQKADLALVVAYGRILPGPVLAATRLGFVNVHASLLPKYRGAAPIAWAVVDGEAETGITLMLLDEGMDTGDMLARVTTAIGPNETQGELSQRLSILGAEEVRERLPLFVLGKLPRTPQTHADATMARMLEKSDGALDFEATAKRIHDRVRGMNPRPGAFSRLAGKTIKIHATHPIEGKSAPLPPGTVVIADKSGVVVACAPGGQERVVLARVQLEGRRPISAGEWVGGRGIKEGDRLGQT